MRITITGIESGYNAWALLVNSSAEHFAPAEALPYFVSHQWLEYIIFVAEYFSLLWFPHNISWITFNVDL